MSEHLEQAIRDLTRATRLAPQHRINALMDAVNSLIAAVQLLERAAPDPDTPEPDRG